MELERKGQQPRWEMGDEGWGREKERRWRNSKATPRFSSSSLPCRSGRCGRERDGEEAWANRPTGTGVSEREAPATLQPTRNSRIRSSLVASPAESAPALQRRKLTRCCGAAACGRGRDNTETSISSGRALPGGIRRHPDDDEQRAALQLTRAQQGQVQVCGQRAFARLNPRRAMNPSSPANFFLIP